MTTLAPAKGSLGYKKTPRGYRGVRESGSAVAPQIASMMVLRVALGRMAAVALSKSGW